MKSWQKIVSGILMAGTLAAVLIYVFRTDLILWGVKNRDQPEIAAQTPQINWQKGLKPPSSRSTNDLPTLC